MAAGRVLFSTTKSDLEHFCILRHVFQQGFLLRLIVASGFLQADKFNFLASFALHLLTLRWSQNPIKLIKGLNYLNLAAARRRSNAI